MAKLVLIFIVVFIVVHVVLAARVPRDTPVVNTETGNKAFEDLFNTFKKGFQDTFNKENLDKALSQLGQMGDKFGEVGKQLADKVQKNIADIGKKE